jgi:uncharacterized membrane protein YbhN (UPF0104 family)
MKTKVRKTYNLIISLLIIVATYGFIYKKVFFEQDISHVLGQLGDYFQKPNTIIFLSVTIFLMFINWGIEARKWQFLIDKIENVPFGRSVRGVLAGVAISSFTPNRIGEFLGRIFVLKDANRIEGIFITIIGSISQFIITFLTGTVAIAIFVMQQKEALLEYFNITENTFLYFYLGLALLALAIYAFILMVFMNVSFITDFVKKVIPKNWRKIRQYMRAFYLYSRKDLLKVLGYSFLRFIVFTIQFYILIRLFNVPVALFQGMIMVSMIFFVVTMVPTIALTELGIRGSIAIFFFSLYFQQMDIPDDQIVLGVISASSSIWLINLVIPALIGAIFAFNLKFFRKNG